jgi:hypothetical protein
MTLRRTLLTCAAVLLSATPGASARIHADTNPVLVALARAESRYGAPTCPVEVVLDSVAPFEQGGVSVSGCVVHVSDQSWAGWGSIDTDGLFPQFCELVSYGYAEVKHYGRAAGWTPPMTMTPQCARHVGLWWHGTRWWQWWYAGDSSVSDQFYPRGLSGV